MNPIKFIEGSIKAELDDIITQIINSVIVNKVILFGSYAYGTAGENSDIDLCIITEDKRRKIEIIQDIQEAAYKAAKHPLDILVYRPEEFTDRSVSVATIEKTIADKGVLIYG